MASKYDEFDILTSTTEFSLQEKHQIVQELKSIIIR